MYQVRIVRPVDARGEHCRKYSFCDCVGEDLLGPTAVADNQAAPVFRVPVPRALVRWLDLDLVEGRLKRSAFQAAWPQYLIQLQMVRLRYQALRRSFPN